MSWDFDGVLTTVVTPEQLQFASIQFLGKLSNMNGEPVSIYRFVPWVTPQDMLMTHLPTNVPVQCNFSDFEGDQIELQQLIQQVNEVTTLDDLDSVLYQIDAITFRDGWYGCELAVNNMVRDAMSGRFLT